MSLSNFAKGKDMRTRRKKGGKVRERRKVARDLVL